MPNKESENQPFFSKGYRNYVLFALTGVYTFNFIDRQIVVILTPYLREDLGLSYTQIGYLTGLAFAAFYVILGIPIARLADRSNRKNIVSISLAVWSAMTALSGMATNFLQLLLARIGVGVGEAGGSPPSHSIISDYFPPKERGRALGIYSSGVYIGIFLGYLMGGLIAKYYGWRMAFFALGIPGVLYAILIYFTIKEPPKGLSDKKKLEDKELSFLDVFKLLFTKKTFVFVALASGFHAFASYGVGNFTPLFLDTIHGLEKGTIAVGLAFTKGGGGIIGAFMGGYFADRFGSRDIRGYMWVMMGFGALALIPYSVMFFTNIPFVALGAIFFVGLFTSAYLGPILAVTHSLVDAKKRALASAVLFFILNLIGLGLGPLTIGALRDFLAPTYGDESIRMAFMIAFVTTAISLTLFYLASRTYRKELEIV